MATFETVNESNNPKKNIGGSFYTEVYVVINRKTNCTGVKRLQINEISFISRYQQKSHSDERVQKGPIRDLNDTIEWTHWR